MVRRFGLATIAAGIFCLQHAAIPAVPGSSTDGNGGLDAGGSSLQSSALVLAFEHYLKADDIDEFQRRVDSHYTEASLSALASAHDINARRAAVLALGLSGTFGCNAILAQRLKDRDAIVRSMAVRSLWAIWRRGDRPEHAESLRKIQVMVGRGLFDDAIRDATRLISSAPDFAEAYNERAIAHFSAGRLAQSADDCRRVLERNPYHFGALGGLAQCQIGLAQRADAIRTLRRALELQPHSDDIREFIAKLEAAQN